MNSRFNRAMPLFSNPVLVLGILVIGLAACGDNFTPAPGGSDPVPPQGSLTIHQVPDYAVGNDRDVVAGVGTASVGFPRQEIVFGRSKTQLVVLATSAGSPQGVRAASDQSGGSFVLVVICNFMTNSSQVDLYRDMNLDGLPDQASKSTLFSLPSAHLSRLVLDRTSGTAYVVDRLNDRILRFSDTTGDLVPEGNWTAFWTGSAQSPINARQLANPTANAISVYLTHVYSDLDPQATTVASDVDQDGVADSFAPGGHPGTSPTAVYGHFIASPMKPDASVLVEVSDTGSYQIVAEDSSGLNPSVLATFTGTTVPQTVSLSRALEQDEIVWIVASGSGVKREGFSVLPQGTTIVHELDPETGAVAEMGTLTVNGQNFTGSEAVEVRAASDTAGSWTSCTISSWTVGALSVSVPALNLTGSTRVHFRITPSSGGPFIRPFIMTPGP